MRKSAREKHKDVYYIAAKGNRGAHIKFLDRVFNPETGIQELRRARVSIKSLGFTNKREALPWMQEKSRQIQEWKANPVRLSRADIYREERLGIDIPNDAMNRFLEEFESSRRSKDPKRRTKLMKDMKSKLAYFRDFLFGEGDRWASAEHFNEDALREFRVWLLGRKKRRFRIGKGTFETDRPLSAQRLHTIRQATLQFCYWLRSNRYITLPRDDMNDAFAAIHRPSVAPQRLSTEELNGLINALVSLDKEREIEGLATHRETRFSPVADMFLLLMLTGMRAGEAVASTWDDVDLERKVIRIRSTKTGIERELGFRESPALVRLLQALRIKRGECPFVLSGDTPSAQRAFCSRQMTRIREACGSDRVSRKILRSTFASCLAMAKNDWDPWALARAMGHSVDVANRFYVTGGEPILGDSFEQWLGVEKTVNAALDSLYPHTTSRAARA